MLLGIKCTKIPPKIATIDFLLIEYYIKFKNKHDLVIQVFMIQYMYLYCIKFILPFTHG